MAPLVLPTSPDFLGLQAARGGGGGLVFADRRIPWGELDGAVVELAAWLGRRGLGAGQRVGVMAGNVPAMASMLYAVWGSGAVAVPIGTRATAEEIGQLCSHARARMLLCDEARAETARAAGVPAVVCAPDLPLRPRVLRRPPRVTARLTARRTELAVIAYTSGTTGVPKGVMLTHGNVLWATLACAQARGDASGSVGACLSPLTHVPVLVSHLLCRILMGGTAVLFQRFDLEALLDAVPRHGITDLPLIGGMVFDVVGMREMPLSVRTVVRKVSVGGAPTPMDAKRALAAMLPEAEIIEAYGQTESTDGVTMARGTTVLDRPGTVGTTNPHVVVACRRADGRLADPDEEGEVVVGGPTIMQGYWREAAATAGAIRDGWLHTGDVGRRDAAGFLFLTGRVKDIIISGGENVSPAEVEAVLRAHPDVVDVAVIGTPHPRWGEQVTAVVVCRPGAAVDGGALADFAGRRLASFKKPRRVEFVLALPRNAHNKVETHRLKEQFA